MRESRGTVVVVPEESVTVVEVLEDVHVVSVSGPELLD